MLSLKHCSGPVDLKFKGAQNQGGRVRRVWAKSLNIYFILFLKPPLRLQNCGHYLLTGIILSRTEDKKLKSTCLFFNGQ